MKHKWHLLGLLVPSLLLSACSFNLGEFEKDDQYEYYYSSFSNLKAKYDGGEGTGAEDDYNIKESLFNDYTVDKLDWESGKKKVTSREYVYLILQIKGEFKIEEINLYFKATETLDLNISMFYFINEEAAPKNIRYKSSPAVDPETGEPIQYDDPEIGYAIHTRTVNLIKDNWSGVNFKGFKQEGYGDGLLHTSLNSLLYIRAENNTGPIHPSKISANFTFLNLMIRAI